MISKIFAEVLKEVKRLGGELPIEEKIALHEYENHIAAPEEVFEWKKKNPLKLV
jgi:hypothetical protein